MVYAGPFWVEIQKPPTFRRLSPFSHSAGFRPVVCTLSFATLLCIGTYTMSKPVTVGDEPPKSMDPLPSHTASWTEEEKAKYPSREEDVEFYRRVGEGNTVVLRHKRKGCYFTPAAKGLKASVFKNKILADNLVGAAFGDRFEMSKKHFERVKEVKVDPLTSLTDRDFVPTKDNSQLIDHKDSQKLSAERIEELKKEGKTGAEIAELLAQSSSTFDSKTEFSQEKYLKKKKEKFDRVVEVLPPSVETLADVYWGKSPSKILNLRPDMLSLLLAYSSVQAGNVSLVIESTCGLVTAAVASRQGGFGSVLSGYSGSPSIEALRKTLMPQIAKDSVIKFPLDLLGQICQGAEISKSCEAAATLLKGECDSLVVASRFSTPHMFLAAFPYLAPSGCFAVYCEQVEPLIELWEILKAKKYPVVQVQILDSWFREYQVLPNRTHPLVRMSATSGYLFTGVKTCE